MYCNTLMANDAVFCPKCGRKQSKYVVSKKQLPKQEPPINLNATPPVEMSNKFRRDLRPIPIADYKEKIGFNADTSHCTYAIIGSQVWRTAIGNSLFGLAGGIAGDASVGRMILSVERNGILLLGLNSITWLFNGRNKFIKNDEINSGHTFGNMIVLNIKGNDVKFKIPHIYIGMSDENHSVIRHIINKRFNKEYRDNEKLITQAKKKNESSKTNNEDNQLQNRRKVWATYIIIVIVVFSFLFLITASTL